MKTRVIWLGAKDIAADRPTRVIVRRSAATPSTPQEQLFGVRGRAARFWVPGKPLVADDPAWGVQAINTEALVVPLYPYTTAQLAKACILASGLELGFRAALDLAKLDSGVVDELQLYLCTLVYELTEFYRMYAGLAIRMAD